MRLALARPYGKLWGSRDQWVSTGSTNSILSIYVPNELVSRNHASATLRAVTDVWHGKRSLDATGERNSIYARHVMPSGRSERYRRTPLQASLSHHPEHRPTHAAYLWTATMP